MFPNLKAEMARKHITLDQVATTLKLNVATVSIKFNKYNRLKYCECVSIRNAFFPNLTIDYLFKTDDIS